MVDGFHMVVRIPIFQTNVQQLEGKYIRRFLHFTFIWFLALGLNIFS
jgi:hypothetical protein